MPWTVLAYLDVSEHRGPHSLDLAGTSLPSTGTREGCDSGEVVIHHMVEEILPGAVRSVEREGGREGGRVERKDGREGGMGEREGGKEGGKGGRERGSEGKWKGRMEEREGGREKRKR